MARVTVRSFAALRELLGPPFEAEATDVAGLLATLRRAHGAELDRRLTRATVAVGERTTTIDDTTPLADGDEVVLLPPFAGG